MRFGIADRGPVDCGQVRAAGRSSGVGRTFAKDRLLPKSFGHGEEVGASGRTVQGCEIGKNGGEEFLA